MPPKEGGREGGREGSESLEKVDECSSGCACSYGQITFWGGTVGIMTENKQERGRAGKRTVHLRSARNHVLDIVSVAGTVDVGVMPLGRLVLHMRGVDGDFTVDVV